MRIAVFDSGLGGFSVLKAIGKQLPSAQFLYLGDTARLPYGSKSPAIIQGYTRLAARFLSQQRPDALVIACHTASAWAADLVRGDLAIPVFDMIGPTIRRIRLSQKKGPVGVLGTRAMIASGAYQSHLGREVARPVWVQACPLLAPIVEEGLVDHAVSDLMASSYLEPFRLAGVKTVILGCTHYSALMSSLQKALDRDVEWVDPAQQVARELALHFGQTNQASLKDGCVPIRFEAVFVTDDPFHFGNTGSELLGQRLESVQLVNLDSVALQELASH
jgi:glutamate racemase